MSAGMVAALVAADAMIGECATVRQLLVLAEIAREPGRSTCDVAARLRFHRPNVTRACDRLTQAGLVVRRSDPADARKRILTCTEAGQALLQSMQAAASC